MKKEFRLAMGEYSPFLVLRNEERKGIINVLYLDYLLKDGRVASVAVTYILNEIIRDLNMQEITQLSLTGTQDTSNKGYLTRYIHIFESREDWIQSKVDVIQQKEWESMCSLYFTSVSSSLKAFRGKFTIIEQQVYREPLNAVYVLAVLGDVKVEVKGFNGVTILCDSGAVKPEYREDYVELVEYVIKCIGGGVIWNQMLQ